MSSVVPSQIPVKVSQTQDYIKYLSCFPPDLQDNIDFLILNSPADKEEVVNFKKSLENTGFDIAGKTFAPRVRLITEIYDGSTQSLESAFSHALFVLLPCITSRFLTDDPVLRACSKLLNETFLTNQWSVIYVLYKLQRQKEIRLPSEIKHTRRHIFYNDQTSNHLTELIGILKQKSGEFIRREFDLHYRRQIYFRKRGSEILEHFALNTKSESLSVFTNVSPSDTTKVVCSKFRLSSEEEEKETSLDNQPIGHQNSCVIQDGEWPAESNTSKSSAVNCSDSSPCCGSDDPNFLPETEFRSQTQSHETTVLTDFTNLKTNSFHSDLFIKKNLPDRRIESVEKKEFIVSHKRCSFSDSGVKYTTADSTDTVTLRKTPSPTNTLVGTIKVPCQNSCHSNQPLLLHENNGLYPHHEEYSGTFMSQSPVATTEIANKLPTDRTLFHSDIAEYQIRPPGISEILVPAPISFNLQQTETTCTTVERELSPTHKEGSEASVPKFTSPRVVDQQDNIQYSQTQFSPSDSSWLPTIAPYNQLSHFEILHEGARMKVRQGHETDADFPQSTAARVIKLIPASQQPTIACSNSPEMASSVGEIGKESATPETVLGIQQTSLRDHTIKIVNQNRSANIGVVTDEHLSRNSDNCPSDSAEIIISERLCNASNNETETLPNGYTMKEDVSPSQSEVETSYQRLRSDVENTTIILHMYSTPNDVPESGDSEEVANLEDPGSDKENTSHPLHTFSRYSSDNEVMIHKADSSTDNGDVTTPQYQCDSSSSDSEDMKNKADSSTDIRDVTTTQHECDSSYSDSEDMINKADSSTDIRDVNMTRHECDSSSSVSKDMINKADSSTDIRDVTTTQHECDSSSSVSKDMINKADSSTDIRDVTTTQHECDSSSGDSEDMINKADSSTDIRDVNTTQRECDSSSSVSKDMINKADSSTDIRDVNMTRHECDSSSSDSEDMINKADSSTDIRDVTTTQHECDSSSSDSEDMINKADSSTDIRDVNMTRHECDSSSSVSKDMINKADSSTDIRDVNTTQRECDSSSSDNEDMINKADSSTDKGNENTTRHECDSEDVTSRVGSSSDTEHVTKEWYMSSITDDASPTVRPKSIITDVTSRILVDFDKASDEEVTVDRNNSDDVDEEPRFTNGEHLTQKQILEGLTPSQVYNSYGKVIMEERRGFLPGVGLLAAAIASGLVLLAVIINVTKISF